MNAAGSFHCKCKTGYTSSMECRPVVDLGLSNGGISDDSVTVSSTAAGFEKGVSTASTLGIELYAVRLLMVCLALVPFTLLRELCGLNPFLSNRNRNFTHTPVP